MNSKEFPTAVAASQHPCIKPCKCGGATLDTNESPSGDMNNSATVRIKYSPIIIHGVTRITSICSADMVDNTSFAGNVKEKIIKNK